MKPVICIPYCKSDKYREKAYLKTKEYYSKLNIPIFYSAVSIDSFNRAKSRNNAVKQINCEYDLILFFDADIIVPYDQIQKAIKLAYDTNEMVLMYDVLYLLSERVTKQYYKDDSIENKYGTILLNMSSGAFVVPKSIWEEVGGQDERFTSWGGEDRAFYFACAATKNKRVIQRIEGKALHLYHPRKKYTIRHLQKNELLQKYVKAVQSCPRFTVPDEFLEDNSEIFSLLKEEGGPLYKKEVLPIQKEVIESVSKVPIVHFVTTTGRYETTELNSPLYHALKSDTQQFKEIKLPNITVSIPCYKSKGYLRKAVDSILNQTYPNFELLVISDNDPDNTIVEIKDIENSKLKIIELKENIGRYAIDHMVVTELSKNDWWVPFDSDDWCTPNFLYTLMNQVVNKNKTDVVFSPPTIHNSNISVRPIKKWNRTTRFIFHAHMVSALWNREFLVNMHLTNPNFRIGWDSIMTAVPWIFEKVKTVNTSLYHVEKRKNSLTCAEETCFGSPQRLKVRKYLEEIWKQIVLNKNRKDKIIQLLKYSRTVKL